MFACVLRRIDPLTPGKANWTDEGPFLLRLRG
jgi:hypothetical protein